MFVLATPDLTHPLGYRLFSGFNPEGVPQYHAISVFSFERQEFNFVGMMYPSQEFAFKDVVRLNGTIKDRTGTAGELFVLPMSVLVTQLNTWAGR